MKLLKNNFHTKKNFNLDNKTNQFGPYLAGLIEADGTINMPKNLGKKKYNPRISICFHKSDLNLAYKIKDITKCGVIYFQPHKNHGEWIVSAQEEAIKIITIINGFFRTPKIEALHKVIKFYNAKEKLNIQIPLLGLDKTPINSNSWFAGYTDADATFTISLITSKTKTYQIYYRLEQRQMYHKEVEENLGGASYFTVLNEIAKYLGVTVYSKTRTINKKLFYSYLVTTTNHDSKNKLIAYFEAYPLFSSKYLNYKDWLKIIKLKEVENSTKIIVEECEKIRKDYNSTRTTYNWDHLDNFYQF